MFLFILLFPFTFLVLHFQILFFLVSEETNRSSFILTQRKIFTSVFMLVEWPPFLLSWGRARTVKNPPAIAGHTGGVGSIPELGRSPGENGTPLQYSCLENPMDREAWQLQSMGSQRAWHNWATNTLRVGAVSLTGTGVSQSFLFQSLPCVSKPHLGSQGTRCSETSLQRLRKVPLHKNWRWEWSKESWFSRHQLVI